jgi:hypothetical protein
LSYLEFKDAKNKGDSRNSIYERFINGGLEGMWREDKILAILVAN